MLYPLSAGAMAINVFLLGLMGQAVGFEAIDPVTSVLIGLVVGVPATWWFGARFRALMDEADR